MQAHGLFGPRRAAPLPVRLPALLAIAVGIASHPVFAQVSAPISRAFTEGGIYAFQSDPQATPQPSPTPQQPDSGSAAAPAPQNPAPFDRSSLSGYNTREKFIYDTKNVFGPVPLVFNALGAGLGQALNSPSQWGQGVEGYADRFASSFGTNMAHQYIGFGLESALHEDPRYMLSADRTAKGRLRSVLRQSFTARKDAGGDTFAYARIGSAFGAGLLSNTWQPNGSKGIGDGFIRGTEILAIDIGSNLAQEFIPFIRRFQIR
jgi:hypothetical protein